ncbi:outer membrane autotransporter barrel domain protein [Vulgatibacter incomptus]|uniref:Outer membrane autotransporter barrel domain protein n=1 Tax=Vulgatibacter incomptus TaxID=1391653 RepID=A0A0K1PD47_9BACT|nr:outer membrane autotransporter barrel domain protein [Vulgatibacter incomptus]
MAGALVALDGVYGDAISTGADGTFTFADVRAPYDLTVSVSRAVYELRGLTRANPVVPASAGWTVERKVRLAGQVAGGMLPLARDERILLTIGSDTLAVAAGVDGAFDADFKWYGDGAREVALTAIRARTDSDGRYEVLAFGKTASFSIEHGGSVGDLTVPLAALDDLQTEGTTITVDPGAYRTFWTNQVEWFDVQGVRFRPSPGEWMPSQATLRFPGAAGISSRANDESENMAVRVMPVVMGGDTSLSLAAPVALMTTAPAYNAQGVSRTPTLEWKPVAGARSYWLTVGSLTFVLPGAETRLDVPDFGALGGLSAGEGYSWEVRAFLDAGFAADDVTDGSGRGLQRSRLADELTMYGTGPGFFMTAP